MPNVNDIRLLLYAQRRGLLDKSLVAGCFSDLLESERSGTPLSVADSLQRRKLLSPEQTEQLMRELLDVVASGGQVVGQATYFGMRKGVESSLERGQVIDKYKLQQEVSRDGHSVIFRAVTAERTPVAIRILTGKAASSERVVARFHEQASLAQEVDDPNLAHALGSGCFEGLHYVVTPWWEGRTLGELLSVENLPPMMILGIAETIARTCAYMHLWGLVHLDVQPHRIVVDDEGEFFLVDLSLGKDALRQETWGTEYCKLLGTPAYLAPEQAGADPDRIGTWTDVYALGAVLYRCVSGRFPHVGGSFFKTLRAIVTDDPPSLRSVRPDAPARLDNLLRACMARDPRGRPTAKELSDEITHILDSALVDAMPPPPSGEPTGG